jgi:hypothetical protein
MSHHERDKLLRTDLLLLAPIVRELFPELPEMHYTYALPYADDLDEKASDYLSSVLESIRLDLVRTAATSGLGRCKQDRSQATLIWLKVHEVHLHDKETILDERF